MSPENRRILYHTKGLSAIIAGMSGDYHKSIFEFQEVVAGAEKLKSECSEDTRFQYNLWAFERRLGIDLDKSGNFPAAVSYLKSSLAIIENLKNGSAADAGYKRNTAITMLALGKVFLRHEKPKKALDYFLRARQISENLLDAGASNGETIADLVSIYGNLAAVSAALGRIEESISNQGKTLAFFQRCLAKSPANKELRRVFAETTELTAEKFSIARKRLKFKEIQTFGENTKLVFERSRKTAPDNF
ncbi:MAG: tetratricopeptide repeat protein [Pyrinomonadaceae bacterium]